MLSLPTYQTAAAGVLNGSISVPSTDSSLLKTRCCNSHSNQYLFLKFSRTVSHLPQSSQTGALSISYLPWRGAVGQPLPAWHQSRCPTYCHQSLSELIAPCVSRMDDCRLPVQTCMPIELKRVDKV